MYFCAIYNIKNFFKASGLAGGKGVLIPTNKQDALNALKEIMLDKVFGSAGNFTFHFVDITYDSLFIYF